MMSEWKADLEGIYTSEKMGLGNGEELKEDGDVVAYRDSPHYTVVSP